VNYLVTGGLGFIGSHFIEHLLNRSETQSILNIDKGSYAANKNFRPADYRYKCLIEDIGNINKKCDLIKEASHFDVVINFASHSHVDNSLENPLSFLDNNINSFFKFLEVCCAWQKAGKIGKLVHISTDEVYGDLTDSSKSVFDEESPLRPSSPYSSSKAAQEMFIHSFRKTYNLKANILRLSNNFGPRQHFEKFIPTIILHALKNESIPIYGDGSQEREWMYVENCVKYITQICHRETNFEDYCISDGTSVENLHMAYTIYNIVKRIANLPSAPIIEHVKDRLGHDKSYKLNCEKFKKDFQPCDHFNFNQGLRKTVDHFFYNFLKSEVPLPHLAVTEGSF
tara:strand:- start:818 stop:1840 length:1023 start_codon:yes stop_codon:yes gene_type:complete